jgi:hypothetical protein
VFPVIPASLTLPAVAIIFLALTSPVWGGLLLLGYLSPHVPVPPPPPMLRLPECGCGCSGCRGQEPRHLHTSETRTPILVDYCLYEVATGKLIYHGPMMKTRFEHTIRVPTDDELRQMYQRQARYAALQAQRAEAEAQRIAARRAETVEARRRLAVLFREADASQYFDLPPGWIITLTYPV